jgi:hypothetical protein
MSEAVTAEAPARDKVHARHRALSYTEGRTRTAALRNGPGEYRRAMDGRRCTRASPAPVPPGVTAAVRVFAVLPVGTWNELLGSSAATDSTLGGKR